MRERLRASWLPLAAGLLVCAAALAPARAQPSVDSGTLNRIADAGFNHGQVVEIAAHLADQIGGRLTNSPAMRQAESWTQRELSAWGLKNVHAEGFEFGRGWWIESSHVRLLAPRLIELKAIPVAWTPSTNGPIKAPIVVAPLRTAQDFGEWKGKLKGRIVLISWPTPPKDAMDAPFQRLGDADIARLDQYAEPRFDPETRQRRIENRVFASKVDDFLAGEGALAWASMSRSDGRLLHGEGYSYQAGRSPKLPGVEIAAEDYLKLTRLARVGEASLEIDSNVHFEDQDHKAYNILAEIPGSSSKSGYVMAGAHLDSWVAGDGAADNGAGSAIVMEAARILVTLGVRPNRSIRFVLWSGEEQGLLGSAAYVEQHLAHRPPPSDPAAAGLGPGYQPETYPVEPLPEFSQLAAYFNVDNGSGKVRGIYTEGNFAVVPIFREWLAPFRSLGASAVVAQPTGSTDHVFLSRLGLPAFQFIQDPLDYESRVHHSDLDTFDHLRPDDLRQASVVLAALLLDAADFPVPLPRKVLPTEPRLTDPFHYREPSKP
jgi:hypothetical protein